MISKFQEVGSLLESIVLSDKNYGIDLDNFPKKSKTLFISGLSGSGKTSLAKRLVDRKDMPPCDIFNLDDVWTNLMLKNISEEKTGENIVKKNLRIVGNYLKEITKNNSKCKIIEGVHLFSLYELYGKTFIKFLEQYPIILLGTSSIKSSFRQLKRDKQNFKLKYILYNLFDESEYRKFRLRLLSNKSRNVKEVNL
jgi:adenylate kinase family enzyme